MNTATIKLGPGISAWKYMNEIVKFLGNLDMQLNLKKKLNKKIMCED